MVQKIFVLYWGHVFFLSVCVFAAGAWFIASKRCLPASTFALAGLSGIDFRKLGLIAVGAIPLIALGHMAFYLAMPTYADYSEPLMALLGENVRSGGPVYADWSAGRAIIGSNYGPYVFLAQAASFRLLGDSIFVSKISGMLFAIFGLSVFFQTIRYRVSKHEAFIFVGVLIALFSYHLHYWFWNRPEPVIVALVVVGLFAFDRMNSAICLSILGLLAGALSNLKLFAPIYLLPVAVACVVQLGFSTKLLVSAAVGGVLFAATVMFPFLLGPFEAKSYVANILLMRKQGLEGFSVLHSLFFGALIVAMPAIVFARAKRERGEVASGAALVVCIVVTAILSGKPGGGSLYMAPFALLALYFTARMWTRIPASDQRLLRGLRKAYLVTVVICASPIWAYSWYQIGKQIPAFATEQAKKAELRALFLQNPDAQMGHGLDENSEFLRVEKAFLRQPIIFDYVNFGDQRAAGLGAEVIYPLLEGCRVPAWVFSREGGHFVGSAYGVKMFDEGVRERFSSNYRLVNIANYYEVWKCR
ncbi:hypothetical protein BH10PSE10_BH10PSE10_00030 [soil metagenome]